MTYFDIQTNSVDQDQSAIPRTGIWLCGRWVSIAFDVGFWLCGRWILDVWTLDLVVRLDGRGFWLCGRWILVVWMLDFRCVYVGFRLDGLLISVVWTLDFGLMAVGFCCSLQIRYFRQDPQCFPV